MVNINNRTEKVEYVIKKTDSTLLDVLACMSDEEFDSFFYALYNFFEESGE